MQATRSDSKNNLQRIQSAMVEAGNSGADLLLTPELALAGYGTGEAICDLAQESKGEWAVQLKQTAQETDVAVVAGFPERFNGDVFNSVYLIDASKNTNPIVHRKTYLYGDYEKGLFSHGESKVVTMEFMGLKLGFLICYEVEFPENVRRLKLEGVDFVLVPTALAIGAYGRHIAGKVIPVRAFENQVFVAYANNSGNDSSFIYQGMSSVSAPDGRTLASAPVNGSALIYADITPSDYAKCGIDNPYLDDLRSFI